MNALMAVFLIASLGYMIGGLRIKGIELGTAGVLLVALVFGHFFGEGTMLDITSVREQFQIVQNIGLCCFVCAVGFIAGPQFFRDFKKNALSYIMLGIVITLVGAALCVLIIKLFGIGPELSVGMMAGALTSTPCLAAAQEAAGELADLATAGYAITYPFGVIGVVLFVQLMPRILKVNIEEERAYFRPVDSTQIKEHIGRKIQLDPMGFFAFQAAVMLGLILGSIEIPLPGGMKFSLGATDGPLIMSLLFGHFAQLGPIDIRVPMDNLKTFRELGLMLFLIGAGVNGGVGFMDTLQQNGPMLFVYGAAITLIPMIVGFLIAKYILKMRILNNLGSITGGMTSTPALGSLIKVADTDDVASAYAATYPIAMIGTVICAQFIVTFFR